MRKCGIQEYILGDDSAWKGFIDFFQDNISDANILTEEELFEWALFLLRPNSFDSFI